MEKALVGVSAPAGAAAVCTYFPRMGVVGERLGETMGVSPIERIRQLAADGVPGGVSDDDDQDHHEIIEGQVDPAD